MQCAHMHVCSDYVWLELANLYPTALITNHATLHLTLTWHFPMST